MTEGETATENVAEPSLEDRVAKLEWALTELVKELHRHVALRLPDPPPPASEPAKEE